MTPRWLVLGYGSSLRGDDGVGPRAAEAVAAWGLPHVEALALPQLVPELADALAGVTGAVFLDARPDDGDGVREEAILPADTAAGLGHVSSPAQLLALTRALHGTCPAAWLVTIPGRSFAFSLELSPHALLGMEAALDLLRRRLGTASTEG